MTVKLNGKLIGLNRSNYMILMFIVSLILASFVSFIFGGVFVALNSDKISVKKYKKDES